MTLLLAACTEPTAAPPATDSPPVVALPAGRVLTVGAGKAYPTIRAAVAAARDGDTVRVDPGTYTNDFFEVNTRITIESTSGLARLVATTPPPNGKAIITTNTDVTLRGLELTGAKVADRNGAGVRYQGGHLVIEDSYLHDNENGLLAANAPLGSIRIVRSEFAHNGLGDPGQTHNLYVNEVGQLTFDRSFSHSAVVGHEFKSRTRNTTITNSRLFDLDGTASYSIDVPNGGNLTVTGNVIEQGANSQNAFLVAYGEEGLLREGRSVTVSDNTVVNRRSGGLGLLNPGKVPMTVTGNTLYGLTAAQFLNGTTGTVSGNVVSTTPPPLDTSHPFTR
ncbi:right-handed parallel beta-helix repeat-containing protein [Deinococcus hohokamensis]|uniref:Right-handed parallel beta-helix repeat-containing protein n=1 Tax=Deinococcus hohokamensis TaxID=309883 RepID=A0ABV9IAL7_9DEIO